MWIELYRTRKAADGLSANHKVGGKDEWLCEAYMKTDYTKLTEADFQQTINDYLAYLVKEGKIYEA
jgi:type I restriction enzyme M protein